MPVAPFPRAGEGLGVRGFLLGDLRRRLSLTLALYPKGRGD